MEKGCLICGSELVYSGTAKKMECAICHRFFMSEACCIKGHYVCDDCHTRGMDDIIGICMKSSSKDPLHIMEELMDQPFCHMHGPEHHVMVGASLLTAYSNAGGDIDLESALNDIFDRGRKVPGGTCGYWGACGAGLSAGMFVAIVTGSTPMKEEPFGLAHRITSEIFRKIAEIGGPRCCKRDSYIAIGIAVRFCEEYLGVEMAESRARCSRYSLNQQCIGDRCPFRNRGFSFFYANTRLHVSRNEPGPLIAARVKGFGYRFDLMGPVRLRTTSPSCCTPA